MNRRLRGALDRLLRPGSPARAAVSRVFDHAVMPLTPGPPVGLRRGAGRSPSDAPAVLLVLRGADDASTALRLAELAQAQAGVDITPVVVVDAPVLAAVRRAGYAVELLPPDPRPRAEAIVELRRTYGTDAVLVLDAGRPLDVGLLAGLAAPLPRPPVPATLGRALRRFERWYDTR